MIDEEKSNRHMVRVLRLERMFIYNYVIYMQSCRVGIVVLVH